jgi:O-antigen/teichoic acid export membrane protein
MVYLDRFLIGAVISATAVAYYATPYEIVTKVGFLSSALAGVLFPAFASWFSYDRGRTMILFDRASKYFFLVLFPAILLVVTLARDGLKFWLGPEFASHSAGVLQWLAIGVFVNGLSQIPFALLQGAGRPDLTAKLNFLELPIYLPLLWWLLFRFGIDGAACAWTVRVMLESLLLFAMAYRLLPTNVTLVRRMALTVAAGLVAIGVGSILPGLEIKALFLLVTLTGFVLAAWFVVLSPEERAFGRRAIERAKLA